MHTQVCLDDAMELPQGEDVIKANNRHKLYNSYEAGDESGVVRQWRKFYIKHNPDHLSLPPSVQFLQFAVPLSIALQVIDHYKPTLSIDGCLTIRTCLQTLHAYQNAIFAEIVKCKCTMVPARIDSLEQERTEVSLAILAIFQTLKFWVSPDLDVCKLPRVFPQPKDKSLLFNLFENDDKYVTEISGQLSLFTKIKLKKPK